MTSTISSDDLEALSQRDRNFDVIYGIEPGQLGTKYPIKLLRYLFMAKFLDEEFQRLKRPLRVCEIGVDQGQMLLFAKHYLETKYGVGSFCSSIDRWDAVSAKIREEILRTRGYDAWKEINIEAPDFALPARYDVIIVCHILEHLYRPEPVMQAIARHLTSTGSVLGGMPVAPEFVAGLRESRIRKRAGPFGHVSVFSPRRIRAMASGAGLACDTVSGAFCVRRTGSRLENIRLWVAANLAFGRCFPGWPGEIYWRMKRSTARLMVPLMLCLSFES